MVYCVLSAVLSPVVGKTQICLQVWNEEDAEDEVLGMVVRTGMCTSMGAMMRQVIYSARPMSNPLVLVGLTLHQSMTLCNTFHINMA